MEKFKFLSKNEISKLPEVSGVYIFKGKGKIFYIGKATNIRERVKNHFQQPAYRDSFFIHRVKKVGWISTDSEIEALILEANLIKKYQPKYNVVWRDDKNYFYAGITKEDFPTIFITHQPKSLNAKYKILNTKFVGPFVEGRALKRTLEILRKIFPYRTCKPYSGKPCLWYQLGRCPGACLLGSNLAKEIPDFELKIKEESQKNVRNLSKIFEGKKIQVFKNLKKEMKKSAKMKDFEKAAKIRDQIEALNKVLTNAKIFEVFEKEEINYSKIEKVLKILLKTNQKIKRVEAYDVSNIQGKEATGSMVVFVKGKPSKNFYRKFKIRTPHQGSGGGPDDIGMLKEILMRRFSHPEWGLPDLVLIDGGKAQLNAVPKGKKMKAMAIAKKRNELYLKNKKGPILLKKLPREVFNLILQLRDEAHRFAISYHKKLRLKTLIQR